MYCPKCRTEYVENVKECSDCKVLLVKKLPEEKPIEKVKWVALPPVKGEIYADMVEEVLQKKNIPHFTKSDWFTTAYSLSGANYLGARSVIFVPEENRDEATELLEEILGK
jgi:hypothetical protein